MAFFSRKPDPPPSPEEPLVPKEPAVPSPSHIAGQREYALQEIHETSSPLSPLVLQTRMRSAFPLHANVGQITNWGKYSVVVSPERIEIYDELGRRLEDFDEIGSMGVQIQWSLIGQRLGKEAMSQYGGDSRRIKPDDLPFYLRSSGKRLLNNHTGTSIGIGRTSEEKSQERISGQVSMIEGGKYILIFDSNNGMFIAYQTQKDGQELPPRNWIRIDASWQEDIPPELLSYLEQLYEHAQRKTRFHMLNENYVARVADHQINILAKGTLKNASVFADNIAEIGTNVCTDPHNPALVYYCRTENPTDIIAVDTSAPLPWQTQLAHLPEHHNRIENLQLHPNGKFFLFFSNKKLVILARDTLEQIKGSATETLSQINVDTEGRIRALDSENHLIIEDTNLDEIGKQIDRRNVTALAQGIDVHDLFASETATTSAQGREQEDLSHLAPLQEKYTPEFTSRIAAATRMEDLGPIQKAADALRVSLRSRGLRPEHIVFITKNIDAAITEKTRELAEQNVSQSIQKVRSHLDAGISLLTVSEVRQKLETVRSMQNAVSPEVRSEIAALTEAFEQKSSELFRTRGAEVERDIDGLLTHESNALQRMETKTEFDEWREFTLPRLKKTLAEYANNCPVESQQTFEKITAARRKLQEMADQYAQQFEQKYDAIREGAASRTKQIVATLNEEIHQLVERLRSRKFGSRADAERFIQQSPARQQLEEEIMLLASRNDEAAKELSRTLKVAIAQHLYEVERSGSRVAAKDGREMEMFGKTPFPKFEATVEKKGNKSASIQFLETKGSGVKPGEIMGNIGMLITTSLGKKEIVRLWQGHDDEDEYRLGSMKHRGQPIHPSYLSHDEYRKVKDAYGAWKQGKLKKELETKHNALREFYTKREPPKKRTEQDAEWQNQYKKLLEDYAAFCSLHSVPLLRRLEQIENAEEPEYENGKGLVPEWKNHWVVAPEDEAVLEEVAKRFDMQLNSHEGVLDLKGHAGTGKDLYLSMFAHRTRRPYFSIDCSKWTTEFDLSQDVSIGDKNGATVTIRDDSIVLQAIQTPGAIMYFNEFNAMPEQAQIFLHRLFSEERALSLKTSQGKIVHAQKDVLFALSRNPGYPGTFDPQMATKSRMVPLIVSYPPLHRERDPGDTNPNPPYSVSEALKIARSVDSLSDATMDPDMKRNDFVQWWDFQVNGIGENPKLSPTQEFDINVILALTQFANTLRGHFIQQFEKTRASRSNNALPVTQPITLREMRRCAYVLSRNITPEKKATANPERVAKELIETIFLPHIDSSEDRAKIKNAMDTWTSKRRLSA